MSVWWGAAPVLLGLVHSVSPHMIDPSSLRSLPQLSAGFIKDCFVCLEPWGPSYWCEFEMWFDILYVQTLENVPIPIVQSPCDLWKNRLCGFRCLCALRWWFQCLWHTHFNVAFNWTVTVYNTSFSQCRGELRDPILWLGWSWTVHLTAGFRGTVGLWADQCCGSGFLSDFFSIPDPGCNNNKKMRWKKICFNIFFVAVFSQL